MTSTDEYPGATIGLPATGPGSLAPWRARVGAMVGDWAASMVVAIGLFGMDVMVGSGWKSFMILAVYLSVERLDDRLVEAAQDLYASRRRAFFTVLVPMTAGGITAGCQLVFLLSLGDFAVAQFLGGSTYMMGNLIRDQLATAGSLPFGAALTVTLLAGMLALMGLAYLLGVALRSAHTRRSLAWSQGG